MKNQCMTLVLLLSCSTLFSQVFVDHSASGSNNGSSWNNAFTSLSDAIDDASSDSEIWVATGTYKAGAAGDDPASTYFLVDKTLHIYGGFSGSETSLADRDVDANLTVLSGDLNGDDTPGNFDSNRSDNGYHVLWLEENSEGSTVDGFTIKSGNALTGEPPMDDDLAEWSGGGITARSSYLVQNCTFIDNVGGIGAAMYSTGGSTVSVQDCRFENNKSDFGGLALENHLTAEVIHCDFVGNTASQFGAGAIAGNTNATFLDCTFMNNESVEDAAGGLFIFQNNESLIENTIVSVSNSTFTGNTAPFAGGLLMNNFADGSQFLMDGCLFENNSATASDGKAGGFGVRNQVSDSGASNLTANITDCEVKGNTAFDAAGAFFWCRDFNFNLTVTDCEFTENVSENSGGGMELNIFANGRLFAELNGLEFRKNTCGFSGAGLSAVNDNETFRIIANLTDCLFEENTTEGLGGGIALSSANVSSIQGPIFTLRDCDFIDNDAEAGCAGIWASLSSLTVSDSYFEGNSTLGDLAGGGAIGLMDNYETLIERSEFFQNSSGELGGAIYQSNGHKLAMLDNVIIHENEGDNAIYTEDSLMLRNVTMIANEGGLAAGGDDAIIQAQNSIFSDSGDNFEAEDEVEIVSHGGNLSNDNSLTNYLTGSGDYDDQHSLSPMLNDLKPQMGSPCVDRGNPEGIADDATDADGEIRIQGTSVDIGAYESSFLLSEVNDLESNTTVDVFPNPFSNILTVSAETQPELIRLFDMNGKLVTVFPKNETQLTVSDELPTGTYVMELVFENETVQKKVVKE